MNRVSREYGVTSSTVLRTASATPPSHPLRVLHSPRETLELLTKRQVSWRKCPVHLESRAGIGVSPSTPSRSSPTSPSSSAVWIPFMRNIHTTPALHHSNPVEMDVTTAVTGLWHMLRGWFGCSRDHTHGGAGDSTWAPAAWLAHHWQPDIPGSSRSAASSPSSV